MTALEPAPDLTARVRALLAGEPSLREVRMFGGLSFMVENRMVVAARSGGNLLIRVDPARTADLLDLPEVHPAMMGNDREMGGGWLEVDGAALADDADLRRWVELCLADGAADG